MKALVLHAARDLRLTDLPDPAPPAPSDAVIAVKAVGICGSDLHIVQDGRIGDTVFERPLIIGHEFMGRVLAVGEDARDGHNQPLTVGQRVAVDPASPCWRCEMCEHGHPNLCLNHTFYGVYPDNGALQECMTVHARNCFPLPDSISDAAGTLLETLGIALHAVDLGHVALADTVAVIGCGPVGLLIQRVCKLAGATVYAFDKLAWRVEKAKAWGADAAFTVTGNEAVAHIARLTAGRGVDIAFEAAWADETTQQAAEMSRYGGRVVLVGIPGEDLLTMQHSTARRKGLTLSLVRRMKHTYPRAIQLAASGQVALDDLVTHTASLDDGAEAFAMNLEYANDVIKAIIVPNPG